MQKALYASFERLQLSKSLGLPRFIPSYKKRYRSCEGVSPIKKIMMANTGHLVSEWGHIIERKESICSTEPVLGQ